MKKRLEETLAISVLLLAVVAICFFILRACHSAVEEIKQLDDTMQQAEYKIKQLEEIQYAYENLLHTVWIDHPDYVEDSLFYTKEFEHLDFLVDSDFGAAFIPITHEDSVKLKIPRSPH